jgi:hypothetical protein
LADFRLRRNSAKNAPKDLKKVNADAPGLVSVQNDNNIIFVGQNFPIVTFCMYRSLRMGRMAKSRAGFA